MSRHVEGSSHTKKSLHIESLPQEDHVILMLLTVKTSQWRAPSEGRISHTHATLVSHISHQQYSKRKTLPQPCYYNEMHFTIWPPREDCVTSTLIEPRPLHNRALQSKTTSQQNKRSLHVQGLYSLGRHCLRGIGIPIINLRRSDDRLRFIMGIPILIRRCLLSE